MASFHLSVEEAAHRLRVSPQRVRALIASGHLPAEQIGARYVLLASDVASLGQRQRLGGRPLSAQNAWALLAEISGRPDVVRLSRSSRYRLRKLIDSPGDALVRALSHSEPRSYKEAWRVLPSDLAKLSRSEQLVVSGLAADEPRIGMRYQPGRDELDAYVSEEVLEALERRLKPERASRQSNLILRVPQGTSWILEEERAPTAVVAADLLDHQDARVRRAAQAALIGVANGHRDS